MADVMPGDLLGELREVLSVQDPASQNSTVAFILGSVLRRVELGIPISVETIVMLISEARQTYSEEVDRVKKL